ncbi:MAG TPA: hypothetical protein VE821_00105, partial [Pyrinomonadaceae bacterium]|nr:hypothetical protein [Pyrinomonadaceae bacterium]
MKASKAKDQTQPQAQTTRPRIGFHAPIAGGLQNALLKPQAHNCDTVQIFSRNPRGWAARSLSDEEIETS